MNDKFIKNILFFTVFSIIVYFLYNNQVFAEDGKGIYLVIGQQKTLRFKSMRKIAIGDPNVADVKVLDKSRVLLTAKGVGKTTLIIFKKSGEQVNHLVTVSAQDAKSILTEISQIMGDREGISARLVGDKVVLEGKAYTTDDYNRVSKVVEMYPQVVSFVKLNPKAKAMVVKQLHDSLNQAGLKDIMVSMVGTELFLEGSVESQQDLKKAELVTTALGEKVQNLLTVGIKNMIMVEVHVLEVKKSSFDTLGIRWPLNYQGKVNLKYNLLHDYEGNQANKNDWQGVMDATADFGLGMQFNNGYARVLSRPKLVCASGEKANFLAGGEVPIPIVMEDKIYVEYKEFGIILKIQPTADRQGNIQTSVEAEVSDIDPSLSVMNFPGFSVNRAKTNVTVKHGETIVLSGLFNNHESKDVAKFPFLGHIPILGELFKSRDFREKKSELVIFVTPRIVNPNSERIIKTITDIKDRYKRAKDEVGFDLFD